MGKTALMVTSVVVCIPVSLIILLTPLPGLVLASVQAQNQVCQDVGNLTVCGDTLVEQSATKFWLRGNIKIGPKGAPPLIQVADMPNSFDGQSVPEADFKAQFIHTATPDADSGCTDCLFGLVRWINDKSGQALLGTHYAADPSGAEPLISGRLFVDATNRKIFIPTLDQVPLFQEKELTRNSMMVFPYLDRVRLKSFYKGGGDSTELAAIDAEFDLAAKTFKATMPINLRLVSGSQIDNENLRITLRAEVNDQGQIGGSVDDFKAKLAGLVAEAKGIVLKLGEFQAATVDVTRANNPSLPNLDPSQPSLVFQFQNLKYSEGQFSLGGATSPLADWSFGDVLRMKKQSLSLNNDAATSALSFTINSTLEFGKVATGTTPIPTVVKLTRKVVEGEGKPLLEATLQDLAPSIGLFKVNLKGVTLIGDSAENFFGIQAQSAALQWPAQLGGKASAGVGGFKLGIDKDQNVQFNLAEGKITTPEFESRALKGNLAGTVSVVEEVVTFLLNGNLQVNLAGNKNVSTAANVTIRAGNNVCATATPAAAEVGTVRQGSALPPNAEVAQQGVEQPDCLKPYEVALAAFNIKLAGFGIGLTNARGLADGGFAADQASLTLPPGLSGMNGQVTGLAIDGNGNVQIAGGSFEIAPITLAGLQFVGLKGTFVQRADGSYEFQAGGKMPLPGIEPGTNSPGIAAAVTIRAAPDGNMQGLGAQVSFTTAAGIGIPIGATGMVLTSIGGSFDLTANTAQIGVNMQAATLARLPGPMTMPLAAVDGGATLQVNPFLFTTNAQMAVLIFDIANASVRIGHQQGFGGNSGMYVEFNLDATLVRGKANLRVGKVLINGQNQTRFAMAALYDVGLEQDQFGFLLPPFEINLTEVDFQGGVFKDLSVDPPRDTAGMLGSFCVGPFCGSLFVDMQKTPSDDGFVSLVNAEDFSLIDAAAVRTLAAQGVAGYSSQAQLARTHPRTRTRSRKPRTSTSTSTIFPAYLRPSGLAAQYPPRDTIPIVITQTTTLVAGIGYASGAPVLSLELPDGEVLTSESVNGTTQMFNQESAAYGEDSQVFIVSGATPGEYSLIIDEAPTTYRKVSYTLNGPPTAGITRVNCVRPGGYGAVRGVTVKCDNVLAGVDVTFDWESSDADSPNANISAGYVLAAPDDAIDFTAIQRLTEGEPLGDGSLRWNLSEVPTGKYKLAVIVEDGVNAPVVVYSDEVIDVLDQRPPAEPQGLQGTPQAGELLVTWEQNTERDLAGYEIGFGVVQDDQPDTPENFLYFRNMGPKEVITGTGNIVDGKLWGLEDDVDIYYSLRAYDLSGNYSDWAPIQVGTPWPLSPNAWTPAPNSNNVAPDVAVEVAFSVPIAPETLQNAVTVRDGAGQLVQGRGEYITNLNGDQVIGLRFLPTRRLARGTQYTVTVQGGSRGVTAEDGRQMPADYQWGFTTNG